MPSEQGSTHINDLPRCDVLKERLDCSVKQRNIICLMRIHILLHPLSFERIVYRTWTQDWYAEILYEFPLLKGTSRRS